MGVPTNIKTLLSGNVVEWARVEFKETWDPEASLKTICAFANDIDNWGGGYLVIGVEERCGKPANLKGVAAEKIDFYLKDLLNKCKRIQPEYMPITEVADYRGKKFIVVWAPGGLVRPYSSPKTMAKGNKERVYWIRKMASTIAPTEEEKRDLYNLANNVPFDDRINHDAEITDLNITLIQSYLKEVDSSLYTDSRTMDFVDLCRSMNIVNTLPEYTKPKNVGLMFFCLNPQRFFPYAQIDVVQFPDGVGGDSINEKTFGGPLHQQLREALLYISNMFLQERVEKIPGVAEARRFFNYPYAAIEEALANAVYHKGYNEREPIEVRVLPDRIEIVSHPGADRSITMDGLKNYHVWNRRYRNRRIGEFLKELHLTEGRNTGFGKILRALEKNGSPKPIFETDEERTSFAATLFIHPEFTGNAIQGATQAPQGATQAPQGATQAPQGATQAPQGATQAPQGDSVEKRIVSRIEENPHVTQKQIAGDMGISVDSVKYYMRRMRDRQIIAREGTSQKGRWVIVKPAR